MGRLGVNQALATEVVARLRESGVATFCLCPGGRNAPLVEVLTSPALGPGVEVLDFFEERSAAFFALGRARRDGRPVAVVTTSGTACAELLPAMVEAHYGGVPIVAVTADRPRSYRGTAAPQAIEQPGIFSVYARRSYDLDAPGTPWQLCGLHGPAHLNVCFDEPLLGGWVEGPAPANPDACGGADGETAAAADTTANSRFGTGGTEAGPSASLAGTRPLVILGALGKAADREDALDFCRRLGAPVLAEASSHIRGRLGALLLRGGEAAVRHGFKGGIFDSAIRIGDIPSFRTWRDLEVTWRVPVVSVSRKPWAGLTHAVHREVLENTRLSACLPPLARFPSEPFQALATVDAEAVATTDAALVNFPRSEPALVRALSSCVPPESFVYLGNSQPIREWNQFAAEGDRRFIYGENRGANGIDGQLSTFLGEARPGRENWAVVGDLTALYDLQAPWALRHAAAPVRMVVINNGGARIFGRMFTNPRFQNRHQMSFESVAVLWGCEYRSVDGDVEEILSRLLAKEIIIELRPDEAQTVAFWNALRNGGVA